MEILITLGVVVGVILTTAMVIALSMALYGYYWDVKYDIIQTKYYLKNNYNYDDDCKRMNFEVKDDDTTGKAKQD